MFMDNYPYHCFYPIVISNQFAGIVWQESPNSHRSMRSNPPARYSSSGGWPDPKFRSRQSSIVLNPRSRLFSSDFFWLTTEVPSRLGRRRQLSPELRFVIGVPEPTGLPHILAKCLGTGHIAVGPITIETARFILVIGDKDSPILPPVVEFLCGKVKLDMKMGNKMIKWCYDGI